MSETQNPKEEGPGSLSEWTPENRTAADTKSRWSAIAEFDADEADLAQVQTRPVDAVRAEEEDLLEHSKPVRQPRERPHQYPSFNRLATGGVAKKKLTPEELAEKMEKMKIKNQELMDKRLRTEADENQYKEQEQARRLAQEESRQKLKQKREDDTRIQAAIDLQREEVRQRKLQTVLEWDQDKPSFDEDNARPARLNLYESQSRGRGARGRAGGGGRRGRGSWHNNGEDLLNNSQDDRTLPWPHSEEAGLSPTASRGRGRRRRGTSYRNDEDQGPPPPTEDDWPSLTQS